ncbi:hypothetical protein AWC05_28875 [Mycobacterium florentinum]|uniref:Uncharacterized protein n=1 Tax=Mycobacterium florentinum TaxID=292462 RepID=A0A1X1TZH2_MYCFL|nr:hypothetical protein AWC05_28875 [Mycobacterium florentinum]
MVVDDGMDKGVAEQLIAIAAAADARRRRAILAALRTSDEPPPAANRNVAQFLDIDVDQRAWVFVLVAANPLTRADIDVGQPVQSTPNQHRVNRRGRHRQTRRDR